MNEITMSRSEAAEHARTTADALTAAIAERRERLAAAVRLAGDAGVVEGKTYRIAAEYSFRKSICVRPTRILHAWEGPTGRVFVAIAGYRVRPAEPNVSFGNETTWTVAADLFAEI